MTIMPRQTPGRLKPRAGFSLIEVIIATAILMGSAVVLSRLAGMGREQSVRARTYAEAQMLCETTLNELLLGMRVLEPVSAAPLLPVLLDPNAARELNNELQDGQSAFAIIDNAAADQTVNESTAAWKYSVLIDPLPDVPGLWSLTVSVVQNDQLASAAQLPAGDPTTTGVPNRPRLVSFSLTRWLGGPMTVESEMPAGMEVPADSAEIGTFGRAVR